MTTAALAVACVLAGAIVGLNAAGIFITSQLKWWQKL